MEAKTTLGLLAMALLLVGCTGKTPTRGQLVGKWEVVADADKSGEAVTFAHLELMSDGRFEMESFAGTMYGDWTLDGDRVTMKMTGLDDGYSHTERDPGWTSASKPWEVKAVSKDEMRWKMPNGNATLKRAK